MLLDIRREEIQRLFSEDNRKRSRIIIGLIYSLYNAITGLILGSLWHICISVYYTLLLVIKCILFICLKKQRDNEMSTIVFISTSCLMFLISLSLVIPIILMIINERPVSFPLEVAIGIAAYTTYKITVAVIGFVKRGGSQNILVCEIATIGLIEAVVSVLTLQNTLITVNGGAEDSGLTILSAVSSAVGLIFILYLVLRLILKHFNKMKDEPSEK
jgi:hypothetical protein